MSTTVATRDAVGAPSDALVPAEQTTAAGGSSSIFRRPGWPLSAIFIPFPLWWVLGMTDLILLLMTVPMLVHLFHQRAVMVPRAFGWWILFLLWVVVGVALLKVDAFGAVVDDSPTRLLTFIYRLAQYAAITVVLVYVVNTRRSFPTVRVVRAVAWLFVTVTAGGLLGVLAPYFEFRSLLELILPGSLTRIPFVSSLVHPTAAQLQGVLGFEAPRPSAPFSFTNTWGLNFALTLPFFLRAWLGPDAGRRRWFAGPVLLAAAVPGIYSLNRGMWGALLAMALFVVVRAALTRRPGLALSVVAGLVAVAMVVALSPLGTLVALRFSNEGSEVGRTNLGSLAVESVSRTSPVVGLGSTRNVQGNFNSISGGATAQCPRCSPPSLGTQGQLWLVVFSQGLLGLLFFAVFFSSVFLRHLRARSPVATMSLCVMVGWLVTLPVYNSLGIGMLVVMVAVGLLGREGGPAAAPGRDAARSGASLEPLAGYETALRSGVPVLLVFAIVGLSSGAVWTVLRPTDFSASASVLLPEARVHDSGSYPGPSLDTEAQSVTGGAVREATIETTKLSPSQVADDLRVTAIPNTRVLRVQLMAPTAAQASAGVEAAANELLARRTSALDEERRSALLPLRAREAALTSGADTLTRNIRLQRREAPDGETEARTALQRQVRNGLLNEADLVRGEIVRVSGLVLDGGRVVDEVAPSRSGDNLRVSLISGLALGLALGGAIAVVVGPRLRRVRAGSFTAAAGLPLLATSDGARPASAELARTVVAAGAHATFVCVDDDAVAVQLTRRLNRRARRVAARERPVVVAVASGATRARRIRRTVQLWGRQNTTLQGLVVVGPTHSSSTSGDVNVNSKRKGQR